MSALLRRFVFAPIPRLGLTLILTLGLLRVMRWIAPAILRASNVTITGATRNAVMATIVFAAALWLFERKRPRDAGLGLAGAVPGTLRGFLLGAVLLSVVTGVIALGGGYELLGWAPIPEGTTRAALLARVVLIFLAVGIFEEVVFRGILFRQLEQAMGTWLAIIASALFFGLGHRGNPGATWVSSIAIAIEAGGLLAASYVATRSLWIPIGLHWSWNLFEGPVWGSPVSGFPLPVLANARFPGPSLLTGGAFGPEASLPAMLLGGALGAWFLVLAVRRGQIVTPAWMWWIAARVRRPLLEPVAPPPAERVAPPSTA